MDGLFCKTGECIAYVAKLGNALTHLDIFTHGFAIRTKDYVARMENVLTCMNISTRLCPFEDSYYHFHHFGTDDAAMA